VPSTSPERSALALLVTGPEATAAGLELAAPIRYGGTGIGALGARWPSGVAGGDSRARGIMTAAAAALVTAALRYRNIVSSSCLRLLWRRGKDINRGRSNANPIYSDRKGRRSKFPPQSDAVASTAHALYHTSGIE